MTVVTGGTIVSIDSVKRRRSARPLSVQALSSWKDQGHGSVVYTVPRSVRQVRDVVWTALISIVLASVAVGAGLIASFSSLDLTPLAQGAGLASVAFGLAGLSDKFDPHSTGRD